MNEECSWHVCRCCYFNLLQAVHRVTLVHHPMKERREEQFENDEHQSEDFQTDDAEENAAKDHFDFLRNWTLSVDDIVGLLTESERKER